MKLKGFGWVAVFFIVVGGGGGGSGGVFFVLFCLFVFCTIPAVSLVWHHFLSILSVTGNSSL